MASFGEELRRERELRDISLKEISEATKISIRFLEALEQNNFDILPGGIFNRGFIRSYARFIGIDGEEMVNAYLHEISVREVRKAQAGGGVAPPPEETGGVYRPAGRRAARADTQPAPQGTILPEPKGSSVTWESREAAGGRTPVALWVLAGVVLLGAAGGLLAWNLRGEPASSGSGSSHDQAVKARLERSSPSPATASVTQQDEPAGLEASDEVPAPEGTGEPVVAAPAPSPSAALPSSDEAPAGVQHRLFIRVTEETTQVVVECGGAISFDQQLWPGQSRTLECAEPVVLSAANAGAVEFSLDSGVTTLLGASGEEANGVTVAPPPPPPAKPEPKTAGSKKDAHAGG